MSAAKGVRHRQRTAGKAGLAAGATQPRPTEDPARTLMVFIDLLVQCDTLEQLTALDHTSRLREAISAVAGPRLGGAVRATMFCVWGLLQAGATSASATRKHSARCKRAVEVCFDLIREALDRARADQNGSQSSVAVGVTDELLGAVLRCAPA